MNSITSCTWYRYGVRDKLSELTARIADIGLKSLGHSGSEKRLSMSGCFTAGLNDFTQWLIFVLSRIQRFGNNLFPSKGVTTEISSCSVTQGSGFSSVTHYEGNISRLLNIVPNTQNVQEVTSRAKRCYPFRTITHTESDKIGTKAK